MLKLYSGGLEDGVRIWKQQPRYPKSDASVVVVVVQLEAAPPGGRSRLREEH